jgi:hypothetical protein
MDRGFFHAATYPSVMNESPDPQLRALLRQWRDLEPSPTFAADVHRRIRLSQTAPTERLGWIAWLADGLPRPAVALATAAMVGLTVGAWSGLLSVPPAPPPEQLGFLAPDTLAGSYGAAPRR